MWTAFVCGACRLISGYLAKRPKLKTVQGRSVNLELDEHAQSEFDDFIPADQYDSHFRQHALNGWVGEVGQLAGGMDWAGFDFTDERDVSILSAASSAIDRNGLAACDTRAATRVVFHQNHEGNSPSNMKMSHPRAARRGRWQRGQPADARPTRLGGLTTADRGGSSQSRLDRMARPFNRGRARDLTPQGVSTRRTFK